MWRGTWQVLGSLPGRVSVVHTKKHDLPTYPEPPGNPIYLVRKPLLTVTPTLPRPYLPIASAKRASTDTLPGKEPRTWIGEEGGRLLRALADRTRGPTYDPASGHGDSPTTDCSPATANIGRPRIVVVSARTKCR